MNWVLIHSLGKSVLFRRSIGFAWHLAGIVLCYYLAFHLRFDFGNMHSGALDQCFRTMPLTVAIFMGCIFLFRLHQALWQYFTFRDCLKTALAFLVGTIVLSGAVYLANGLTFKDYPRSVFLINYLLVLGWQIGGRGLTRIYREWRRDQGNGVENGESRLVVVGDPEEADSLIRSLGRQSSSMGRVAAVVTDGPQHQGGELHGIPLHGNIGKVGEVVADTEASTLLFLPPFTSPRRIREVIDRVAEKKLSCDYRVIPSIDDIASGKVDVSSIKRVNIEDLLHREPYQVDTGRMRESISGKRILVTGAGGSIGSEICRQLLKLNPRSVTLFDNSEFNLFNIERELAPIAADCGIGLFAIAGDIRRGDQLKNAIRQTGGIDILYHAAAYKHVDLMERNPVPCFQNNVIGTQIAAAIAEEEKVGQFVLISSDKAVRPASMMGASKRLAERVVIERPRRGTAFKAVRFGNVLGSSGSVVPIFREQIEAGGPVTVSTPEVTRYFMTTPEAVELVLAAGAVGDDRHILVLEMGEPVKILSLARRMIELSGFVPDVDIGIEFTGLKPGEKECEELLTDNEDVVRTDHDRIWVVRQGDPAEAGPFELGPLLELIDQGDPDELRRFAHRMIPESGLLPDEMPDTVSGAITRP